MSNPIEKARKAYKKAEQEVVGAATGTLGAMAATVAAPVVIAGKLVSGSSLGEAASAAGGNIDKWGNAAQEFGKNYSGEIVEGVRIAVEHFPKKKES